MCNLINVKTYEVLKLILLNCYCTGAIEISVAIKLPFLLESEKVQVSQVLLI